MAEGAAKKILIVDDDPDIVESLSLVLGQQGYTTVGAGSPEDGMAKVHSERPDLIVLDVMMPNGSEGFHFVWDLRKDSDPACRDLPVIMLTAVHESSSEKFYPDQSDGVYQPHEYLPVQAFFDKPVPFDELVAEVKRLLQEKE
jgi:CheY-like chemotaxis protein